MGITLSGLTLLGGWRFKNQSADTAVIISHGTSPYYSAYKWNDRSGFGTKYANVSPAFTSTGFDAVFSNANDAVILTNGATPYIAAYQWTYESGFGTKYSNPSLPTSICRGVAMSPAGNAVAAACYDTPYVVAYKWDNVNGLNSKYSNPVTSVSGRAYDVAFSPDGSAVAVAHELGAYFTVYTWSYESGFGTKYSDPAVLPPNPPGNPTYGMGVKFSPAGDAILGKVFQSPYITAWTWNNATGFGTKYSDPITTPNGSNGGLSFNAAGTAVAVSTAAASGQSGVVVYPWSYASGFGTTYSDPAVLPGASQTVKFSNTGGALIVGQNSSPRVAAYAWDDVTGFGAKYSNPAIPPTGSAQSISFQK